MLLYLQVNNILFPEGLLLQKLSDPQAVLNTLLILLRKSIWLKASSSLLELLALLAAALPNRRRAALRRSFMTALDFPVNGSEQPGVAFQPVAVAIKNRGRVVYCCE